MNVKHLTTLQQVTDFIHGSASLAPEVVAQAERYEWIEHTLRHFRYSRLSKPDKGLIIAYLCTITGYSRQQITRLNRRYREQGRLRWDMRPANGFSRRYSEADVRLLAAIDALHDNPVRAGGKETL